MAITAISHYKKTILTLVFVALGASFTTSTAYGAPQTPLTFPVIGSASYTNDYDGVRSNGTHRATDIFAKKGQKIVSATDGKIEWVQYPDTGWGYAVIVKGVDNYCYWYLHINNDNPGTDDGKATGEKIYAPDMAIGNPIKKGQLIGYLGDSGNAETTPPHLHFSMHKLSTSSATCNTQGEHDVPPVNPYSYLNSARHISKPVTPPTLANEITPYSNGLRIGTNLERSNVSSQTGDEYITSAGAGGGPHVKIFSSSKALLKDFYAYNLEFRGGVHIATADFNNDNLEEIVTSAGKTGGPHVKIYKQDGSILREFYAGDIKNRNGINTAAGDVTGDSNPEIVVVPDSGSNPTVQIYTSTGELINTFPIYNTTFSGGADVAIGDVNNDGKNEIITSAGKTGGPHVVIYDADGKKISEFFAYNITFRGGTRVSVGNVNTKNPGDEIVTSPASTGGPDIRVFSGTGKQLVSSKYFIEQWWRNASYDVAAASNTVDASASYNRRFTVRTVY